ncbi:MAG TPA: FtsX-like permease family protein [Verrucomicrobiae bacterium]|nr:FtsX-like permease family protein [Verrucomicrobiae bacterium]
MKYFPLVWAALWRRKPRTILTMLSIVVAFLLYGLLQGVVTAFSAGVDIAGADRLITTGKYSLTQMQPVGYGQQIRTIPGVRQVAYQSWFGGIYQTERNFFAQFPTDVEPYLDLYPEILLPADQKTNFLKTRTGAIVIQQLADRYGWKVGDKIPIQSTIWPQKDGSMTWEFDLVGIFDTKDAATRAQHEYLLFHNEYFEQARQFGAGTVGWFVTSVADPTKNAEVARAIDARFANSPSPTKTDSEKAFNQGFVKQFGNLKLILAGIMSAVIFTLLMLTGNTMMQSVRERTAEIAVLKTLGYQDQTVLWVVLAEALFLCGIGAGGGLLLAAWLAPGIGSNMPGFAAMQVTPSSALTGLALAAGLALVVGLPPALRAMRLDIVNALTRH